MANRTDPAALSVRGQNPQSLIEAINRQKIYSCRYWKENCMGLNAETIVDEAIKLEYVAGTYGGARKPSKFLVLVLKLLQICPDREIVLEYIKNKDYKYISALAAFYLRLVGNAVEIYTTLEALYSDNRKLRFRNQDGTFKIIYMDEFIDLMLTSESLCDTNLPIISKRNILEENGQLKPRVSILEQELEKELLMDQQREEEENKKKLQEEAEQQEQANKLLKQQQQQQQQGAQSAEDNKEPQQQVNQEKVEEVDHKTNSNSNINNNNKDSKDKDKDNQQKSHHHRHHHHHHHHSKDKSNENNNNRHNGGKNWRKILKDKHKHGDKDQSRSRSRNKSKERQKSNDRNSSEENVKLDPNSVEYWNKIRKNLGIALIPENDKK